MSCCGVGTVIAEKDAVAFSASAQLASVIDGGAPHADTTAAPSTHATTS
ncbi:hypothetical protein GCM10009693_13060 [Leucobacter chromiireducens subsp. chromiireducens]